MKTYDSYKDSGNEWIGEIPSTWKVSRFNHNFSFSRGLPITKQDLKENGIPCVSYGEIHSKYGRIVDPEKHLLKFVDESFLESNSNSLLFRGDFLFADTSEDVEGSGNFTCLDSDIPTFAGYHTVIARLLDRNEFEYKYLSYFLDSIEYRNQIKSSVSGVKVFSITQGILKDTSLVIPPPKEQESIASYLDQKTAEIDELIADKNRLLALYEEEKSAVINQAVTKGINPDAPMKDSGIEWLGEIPEHWEVKKLKHLLKSMTGGGTPSTSNPLFWDGDIPWVSAKDMKSDFIYSSEDYITRLAVDKSSTNYFENERVIIVVRSGILKHTFPVAINKVPICINQDLKGIEPVEILSNEFLFWKLKGQAQNILTFCSKMGATVDSLDMQYLMDFPFGYPTNIDEQKEIVSFIEKQNALIDDKVSKTQKLIDLLTEYRTALISEVVTGKVKVTD